MRVYLRKLERACGCSIDEQAKIAARWPERASSRNRIAWNSICGLPQAAAHLEP